MTMTDKAAREAFDAAEIERIPMDLLVGPCAVNCTWKSILMRGLYLVIAAILGWYI